MHTFEGDFSMQKILKRFLTPINQFLFLEKCKRVFPKCSTYVNLNMFSTFYANFHHLDLTEKSVFNLKSYFTVFDFQISALKSTFLAST